ncbi:Patellin-3 [Hibiscus syriacus]|uniref:Patellin-3 n=1 Tax=Hibiscus syriacus TaxID=106335 RepID=A0A6A2XNK6_HIBSY|nr:Patellin-3 [Hibiscus syriacus]
MAEETQKPEAAAAPAEEVVVEKEKKEAAPPSAATEAVVEEKQVEEDPKVEEKEPKVTQSASFKDETNIVGELPDAQKKALEELKQLIQEALNKNGFSALPPPPPAKEKESKPPAEEKKEEDQPAPAETEEKTEEKAPEKVEAEASAPAEVKEEEEKTPLPAETVVKTEVVEKAPAVEDDGAKTVEAIEESIVAVALLLQLINQRKLHLHRWNQRWFRKMSQRKPMFLHPTEEVSIWGIPLLADERSDVILLKFLRARDFKVKDAFTMLKNTIIWRKEFGVEGLLEEDLGNELERVVFMHGFDKEGHPVCYNAYGEFQNKELYHNTFGDDEKRSKFLRWRIQFLEKSIRKLDFSPTGINTIVQVNDLKNSLGLTKRELRQATNHALNLLQDNYPEFLAKQVFINVPWWYLAFNMMISPSLPREPRASSCLQVHPNQPISFSGKCIAPEHVPVQYGGLSREAEQEFAVADAATEDTIKPATKHTVEFPIAEKSTVVWELRVVGWDVNYGAEFVPTAEDGYTMIVSKTRKVGPADETVISGSFKTGEAGRIVLTIDNQTAKKKKLLYRSKAKPFSD